MFKTIAIDVNNTIINTNLTLQRLQSKLGHYKVLKTVFKTLPTNKKSFKKTFKEFASTKNFFLETNSNINLFYKDLATFIGLKPSKLQIKQLSEEFYNAFAKQAFLYPGSKNFLTWTKKHGLALWVVTDWPLQLVINVLESKKISHYFEGFLTSDLFGLKKTLKPFKAFLDKAGTEPKHSLMISSFEQDNNCRKLGIRFLLIKRKHLKHYKKTFIADGKASSMLQAPKTIQELEKKTYNLIPDYL
ncbi:HAD family hydrolase [Candidatus Woesearchaeota archaeon]|nr:HAD family hydrolase [Candidatus Woesearchaeota archaeon]